MERALLASPENSPPLAGEGRAAAAAPDPGNTLGALLDNVATALAAAGFDEPRRRARRLAAAALDLSAAAVFAHPERLLTAGEQARLAAMLRCMLAHQPLSRILGRREFWGLEFGLSPDTLDPRPETETVVEAVLCRLPDRTRPWRFIDLGTGSGCILLALLSEYPRAYGIGVDLAAGAAATARRNAERLGLSARAHFAVGDWAQAIAGRFDAIVANPPYIAAGTLARLPPEVRDHDPRLALDGGPDGLAAYRALAADLPRMMAPGAVFATEIGWDQAETAAALLAEGGLALDAVVRDLAGLPRCLVVQVSEELPLKR